jgi:hypothetical protein
MKQKDIKKLLELLNSDKLNTSDWKMFSDPEEAKLKYAELKHLRENAGFHEFSFSPFFKERVMSQVYEMTKTPAFEEVLSKFMNRVILSGVITIVLVILILYVYHGQVGVDTLTGIDQDETINFISSLFNEY